MSSEASELAKILYASRGETGDVTFIVGSGRITAHRSVLAALSPKYKAQFYGMQPDRGDVHVKGVSPTAFGEFIKFFYLQEVHLTTDNISEVLNLAKQSLFDALVKVCEAFICKYINLKNVCQIYKAALLYDLKTVKNLCELRIGQTYVPNLFLGDELLSLNLDTLLCVLDIDFLNCTEVEVFEGCVKWASAMCNQKGLDGANGKHLRVQLGDVLPKIRFKSMGLCEFVGLYEKYKGFFSAEEYVQITQTIIGLSTDTSMNQTLRKNIVRISDISNEIGRGPLRGKASHTNTQSMK